MERQTGAAHQRFAEYCHERGVDEDDAVIAMTVTCHIDDLHTIEKEGYGSTRISRASCQIMQKAGILGVEIGGKPSRIDWTKVEYYLDLSKKLRK